jgi:hypothetical protein
MKKNSNGERMSGDGAKQPRVADRRMGARRTEDLEQRLVEVENLARANRRELELQFQRMAHMQADLDMLLRIARSVPARSPFRHEKIDGFEQHLKSGVDPLVAAMPAVRSRPRS